MRHMDDRLCDTSTTSRKKPKTCHIVRHLIKVPQTMAWGDSQHRGWINSAGLGLDPRGVALLLCLAGLYGLLRYTVTQRTREMGVRIALGAQRRDVLWLVMRQATIMLLVGVTLGAALALPSARLIQSFLYGVTAHDGWTLGYAAALLLVSGLSAAYLPARGAASVDPIKALRAE
jgi:FtsX-like permease family